MQLVKTFVIANLEPNFEGFEKIVFGENQCNWQSLCKKEILGPFAPKSACIFGHSKVKFNSQSKLNISPEVQCANTIMKTHFVKKFLIE